MTMIIIFHCHFPIFQCHSSMYLSLPCRSLTFPTILKPCPNIPHCSYTFPTVPIPSPKFPCIFSTFNEVPHSLPCSYFIPRHSHNFYVLFPCHFLQCHLSTEKAKVLNLKKSFINCFLIFYCLFTQAQQL